MIAPTTAATMKSIARNSRLLRKNTVAKKRSSSAPRRSRNAPTNQRNAIPANGSRFNAKPTSLELVFSHSPASLGSLGTEMRSIENAAKQDGKDYSRDRGGARCFQLCLDKFV